MSNQSQREANARYQKTKCRTFCMKLNRNHDAGLIEHLETIPNVQGYIKSLILADIERSVDNERG